MKAQPLPSLLRTEDRMRIFLIGFMGSGKTTLGRLLAKRLGSPFIDLDDEVEQRSGRSVAQIFAALGEPAFRRLELEALRAAVRQPPAVIATGGGLPAQAGALDLMQETGLTVWIHPSFDAILRRLAATDAGERPLLADRERLAALYRDRLPVYRRARLTLDVGDDESAEAVVRRLAGELPCAT